MAAAETRGDPSARDPVSMLAAAARLVGGRYEDELAPASAGRLDGLCWLTAGRRGPKVETSVVLRRSRKFRASPGPPDSSRRPPGREACTPVVDTAEVNMALSTTAHPMMNDMSDRVAIGIVIGIVIMSIISGFGAWP